MNWREIFAFGSEAVTYAEVEKRFRARMLQIDPELGSITTLADALEAARRELGEESIDPHGAVTTVQVADRGMVPHVRVRQRSGHPRGRRPMTKGDR